MFATSLRPICLSLLLSASAIAQTAAVSSSSAPVVTFRSQTRMVVVPVIVHDKEGRPLRGLNKDAFRIEENGHEQQIASFEEVSTAKATAAAVANASSTGYSNTVASDSNPRRITIIVMDLINSPAVAQRDGRRALVKYLSTALNASEPVTLVSIGPHGMRQLHSFTTDTGVLVEALKRLQAEPNQEDKVANTITSAAMMGAAKPQEQTPLDPVGKAIARTAAALREADDIGNKYDQQRATSQTLSALAQVAEAYGSLPGRKSLVWMTAGFPFLIDDPQAVNRMGTDMLALYEQVWQKLNTANIAVYPVDIGGLRGFAEINSNSGIADRPHRWDNVSVTKASAAFDYDRATQQLTTLRAFASATGGIPCVNNNDLRHCLERSIDDAQSFYLVSYYLKSDDTKPGWRKLRVQVSAPGAQARAKEGFYVGNQKLDSDEQKRVGLSTALHSPLEFTEIPLEVNWTEAAGGQRGFRLRVLPATNSSWRTSDSLNLTFAAWAVDAEGKELSQRSRKVAAKLKPETMAKLSRDGLSYEDALEIPAKAAQVRFLVRDNDSGQIGSVFVPVQ